MAAQDSQGIKLFGQTITFNITNQIIIKKEEQITQPSNSTTAVRSSSSSSSDLTAEKPRPDKIIPCPRCKSMETKFCYFNNYNVNQPRHFCKGCHRYWTAGGALRNVPVGAGRRKSKPPPGRIVLGMLGDHTNGVQQVEFIDGLLVNQWQNDAVHGGFRHDFPMKRLRVYSNGQSC